MDADRYVQQLQAARERGMCTCFSCRQRAGVGVAEWQASARLLARFLTDEQLVDLASRELAFTVTSEGGRRYRVSINGGVRALDGPLAGAAFCIVAPGYPEPDVILARKLLLETDERAFLETACGGGSVGRERIYEGLRLR